MHDNTFIGLDVHKATISVAIAQGERGGEVRHYGTISHRPDHVRKLVEKLSLDGRRLHFCYWRVLAAMACCGNSARWGTIASSWPPLSSL
jgi:hypothetical protein